MTPPEATFGRLPPGGAPPAARQSRFRGGCLMANQSCFAAAASARWGN